MKFITGAPPSLSPIFSWISQTPLPQCLVTLCSLESSKGALLFFPAGEAEGWET